jgi:hypothetical protein
MKYFSEAIIVFQTEEVLNWALHCEADIPCQFSHSLLSDSVAHLLSNALLHLS